ncbi:unnamed protein product, partial [Prorocentrum cordatum]
VLLSNPKPYIRHFAGETLAFIVRRLRGARIEAALSSLFALLGEKDQAPKDLAAIADSLSVILFEAAKGIQRGFHTQLPHILRPLFRVHVRGQEASSFSAAARASQLWTIKAMLLRMRNHAGSVDGAADVLDLMFKCFRDAVRRYASAQQRGADGAVVARTSPVPASEKQQPDVTMAQCVGDGAAAAVAELADWTAEDDEQEVLFYVDLIVSWVHAKPAPKLGEDEGWVAFAEAAVFGFQGLLSAASKRREHKRLVQKCSDGTSFPPTALPLPQAVVRATMLLWRALPSVFAGGLCDSLFVRTLAGEGHITQTSCVSDDHLNLLAEVVLPDLIPKICGSPLFPRLVDIGAAAVTSSYPEVHVHAAAAALCSSLLRGAGRECLALPAAGLGSPGSRGAFLGRLLTLLEDALSVPAGDASAEQRQLSHAAAAAGCALSFCQAGAASPAHAGLGACGHLGPADVARSFALLVPKATCQSAASSRHAALVRSRLIGCAISGLAACGAGQSPPLPPGAWPAEGGGASAATGPADWTPWLLSLALEPPLQPMVLYTASEAISEISSVAPPQAAVMARAMLPCCAGAASPDRRVRQGVVRLALVFPRPLLSRRIRSPGRSAGTEEVEQDEEEVPHAEENDGDDTTRKLLRLCRDLEDMDISMFSERSRADVTRKVARAMLRLPASSWASNFAAQILVSQLFVKLSTAWGPAQEALLLLASESADTGGLAAARKESSAPAAKRRRKKRKREAGAASAAGGAAAPGGGDAAAGAAPGGGGAASGAPSAGQAAAGGTAQGGAAAAAAGAGLPGERPPPPPEGGSQSLEPAAGPPPGKRRRRSGGAAAAGVGPGVGLIDAEEPADFVQVSLDPWLQSRPCTAAVDWDNQVAAWWWTEVIWAAATKLILAHEVPDEERAGLEEDAEGDKGQKKHHSSAQVQKPKRKQNGFALGVEGPLDAAESILWRGGARGWQKVLDHVWDELAEWEAPSTSGLTLHRLAWQLATKLLEQNFWTAKPGTLAPWQETLGRQHTEWLLAKLAEHLRERYGLGRAGRTGSKASLLHALQGVASIPSIEGCAPPLVQQCVHGCLHWLLLEQDAELQQLAVKVLARCRRTFPHMAACEASLLRLCADSTFHHELLSLSVTRSGEEADAAAADAGTQGESGGAGAKLYQHRVALLPVVIRILFAKATKHSQALEKRSSKKSRRATVFSYLAALTEEAGVPDLLLVLLEQLLIVVTGSPLSDLPGALPDEQVPVLVTSTVRRAGLLRRLFAEGAGAQRPTWWNTTGSSIGERLPALSKA